MSGRHMLFSAFGLLVGSTLAIGPVSGQGPGDVVQIPIHGDIELGLAPFVERSLEEARIGGAAAVILDIETPGGRVDAAQRIANAIADAGLPVYAFVNRHAYSAGAMIALAADRIYMRPSSVIGAATPIVGSGEKASEKIVSAMRAQMRALAEARGLDTEVAAAMVDEAIEVDGARCGQDTRCGGVTRCHAREDYQSCRLSKPVRGL